MRRPRVLVEGAEYHIIARVNRGEFIFRRSMVKEMFLGVIIQAKRKYSFTVRNFCIMDNHIHLMVRPRHNENLSRIMQWILGVFALRFNRRFGLVGHVWYDRFKSHVIKSLRHLLATFLYITQNPLRANMVRSVFEFRYTGVFRIRGSDFTVVDPPDQLLTLVFPELVDRSHHLIDIHRFQ